MASATRTVRQAVEGYLEETWDDETRDAIVERGADLAADHYAEAVLGGDGDAPAELPDRATIRDVVYGPDTHQGQLVKTALENADSKYGGVKYAMVREQAEFEELRDWNVFDEGRHGVTRTELQLFHNGSPGDYEARITLYPRIDEGRDGEAGEKSVEIALPGMDIAAVQALPQDVLDGKLSYQVNAPDRVSVDPDAGDSADLQAEAAAQAVDQTGVSDSFRYEAAFDGGELTAKEHRVTVTLSAYTPEAEQVLDALSV